MDHAARGAAALSTDPLLALSHYTKALIEHPTSPDYYVQRSTAFTRLKEPHGPRYDLALQDAEIAVLLAQRRAKREKIQAAQQRRVVALFGLQRYGDAATVLESMSKWRAKDNRKDQMEGDMWKSKIEQKMKGFDGTDEALQVTASEYPAIEVPSDAELISILQSELDKDGHYRTEGGAEEDSDIPQSDTKTEDDEIADLESHIGNLTEITSDGPTSSTISMPPNEIKVERSASISHSLTPIATPTAPPTATSTEASIGAANTTLSRVRHEWYQNAESVTLTIYAKGVQKEQADIEIQENSVFISFPHPSNPGTAFTFSLEPLFAPIDPTQSTHAVKSTKVELYLQKKMLGQKWLSLEGTGSDMQPTPLSSSVLSEQPNQPAKGPAYPTSSKSGPKDWDKLAADLTAKGKAKKEKEAQKKSKKENAASMGDVEDDDSGIDSDIEGDPVDGFFKKLYAGSDEDTRRAMMKSYTESGGTALSTNWSEVGQGKVEPVEGKDD